MAMRNRASLVTLTLLAALPLAGPATAACAGDACSLGGRLRAHAGEGLSIPISAAPEPDGDLGRGQPEGVIATPAAIAIQQSPAAGTPGTAPRSMMLAPSALTLKRDIPRPSIVTWCAELPDAIASFNPECAAPGSFGGDSSSSSKPNTPRTNGFVRYAATRRQISGQGQGAVSGTAQMFFNGDGLAQGDPPCVWGTTVNTAVMPKVDPDCSVGLAIEEMAETAGEHQTQMDSSASTIRRPSPGESTANGVDAGAPTPQEKLVPTDNDQRTVFGQDNLEMTSGATSARSISRPDTERRWLLLDVPESGALAAFSAGFLVLLGCYALARRRGR